MSKSQPKTSPARSEGVPPPRRPRTRRTRSTASSAHSEMSGGRLSSAVENFVKDDFLRSPMKRRSVLPDDTDIEAPRRASWWKRLEGSSREVLEALDTNKMTDELLVEEFEFEVEKDKHDESVPESSNSESLASIVVPQKRLFNRKKQPQSKFADIMGSRKSLGKTNIEDQSIEEAPKNLFNKGPRNKPVFPADLLKTNNEDQSIEEAPKNLFNKGPRNKPVFPADLLKTNIEDQSIEEAPKNLFNKGPRNKPVFPADLLNSTNKTINKTVEPEPNKQARPKLFGQAGTKRKNMFADFVLSDSEEDSEVQPKLFGFKNNNKRISLGTRNRRMPSLTPSMTTETDIDDWYLLPSSTMIGTQDVSKMSIDDVALLVQGENQDDTLTEPNESLKCEGKKQSTHNNSIIQDDNNDNTLTNENIEETSKNQDVKINESKKNNKTHERSKSKLNVSVKDKTLLNKSSTRANAENEEIIEKAIVEKQQNNAGTKNLIAVMKEQLLEDKIAELHGESVDKEENLLLNITKNQKNYKDTETENKGEQEIKPSAAQQEVQNVSKVATNVNQNEVDDDLPENIIFSGKQLERTRNYEAQKSQNGTKDASSINRDMNDVCERDKSGREIEPSVGKQESQAHSPGEASNTSQDEDMENESEEEIEPSAEEQETHDHSEERSQTNQDEVMNDISENDKSEPSEHDEENQDESKEESHEIEDEEMDDVSEKDKSKEIESRVNDQESQNDSKEKSYENEEEDMEEMVWNDNDDEKASDTSVARMNAKAKQNDEVAPGEKVNKPVENDRTLERKDITDKSRNLTNKSQKIVESLVDNYQIEEDVVDEIPNNYTHDTTGRNRKKETSIKSPEAVLQNMTTDNESFRPIGRSTTFRKSKSLYDTMNRPSVAPVQESTFGSEGSRNSSTEGSEWDSHRTTRKTIRQTLGKETTRKSFRALVMEQSAKRQTELYSKNTSNINKTKNKSVLEGNDKNASNLNKTKNKTVLDEASKTATVDNTINKTVSEDINNKNASTMNKTKNKTVFEDMDDQHIRFRRTSNRDLSSSMHLQSPIPKSPVHGTSSHHVPDPLISEHQVSYHKSLHDIKYPEISEQISNREDSINIPVVENNDSGPEISLNASYGQGMSADTAHEASLEESESSDVEMKENSSLKDIEDKEIPRRNASVRAKFIHSSDQEVLDYEASELEKSEQDISDDEIDQENVENDDSLPDEEKDNSDPEESENDKAEESELENEDSQQDISIEVESEHESRLDFDAESEHEESQQEIEPGSDQEESQQEIDAESDHEESQQEIEPESDQEESQQEIDAESDHEEPQQEIESEQEESLQEIEPESDQEESQQEMGAESDHDESQQEIESEQEESQQEIEPESDQEQSQQEIEPESDNEERDNSQPGSDQESEEFSREPERHSEDLASGLHSQHHTPSSRDSRAVFDSGMADSDASEQSDRETSRNTAPRGPARSVHDISLATKRTMMLMEMEKITQKNIERKQKIREQMEKELRPVGPYRSPVPNYTARRKIKEPKPQKKPKPNTGFPMEMLPKAFAEDLMYKPPKRYNAGVPWITKRLYKFLETKLEPKYDYRARVRAEELARSLHSFARAVRRRDLAPPQAVDELKREMARLKIVNTHFDFYEFIFDYLPREVRVKVIPDVVNRIPMPRNGIFGEILQSRAVE